MAQAYDFMLDDTNDLLIKDGDFVVSYADPTHIEHIMQAHTGFYRNAPLVGVGIEQYLLSSGTGTEVKRKTRIQLEADGYKVNTLDVQLKPALTISVDADRIK